LLIRKFLAISLLFLFIIPLSTCVTEAEEVVSESFHHRFRGAYTNDGVSLSSSAPETNRTVWTFETDGQVYSSPAVADGKVFIGSWDKNLYALDELTGRELWRFETRDRIYSSPTYWNGIVYSGTGTEGGSKIAKLFAVDAETGTELWSFKAGKNFGGGTTVVDGIVYAGSLDGRLYALDALGNGDGSTSVHWQFDSVGEIWATPAYYNNSLYITSSSCKIYRLDIETGKEIWSFQTEFTLDGMWASPVIGDGLVFTGSAKNPLGKFYALDADTGAHVWNFTTGLSRYGIGASASYYNGTVYIGANNGRMYALNAEDGTELWNFSTGDDFNGIYSSPTYADSKIYFGSSDNFLYCLNATSGELVWSFRSGGFGEYGCVTSPVIVSGRLYVGFTGDDTVYCFGDTIIPSISLELLIIPSGPSSFRDFVFAGEEVAFQIIARDSGSGIGDAGLIIDVDSGELGSDNGTTNSAGVFSTNYTAPVVSNPKDLEVTVSAEAPGFLTEEAVFVFEIKLNPAFTFEIEDQKSKVTAGEELRMSLTALEGSTPTEGVTVELRTTEGQLSPILGSTSTAGKLNITFTAPELDENSTSINVSITIRLLKQGYEPAQYSIDLMIEPPGPEAEPEDSDQTDWVLVGMGVMIVILIVAIVLGLKIKGKKFW
jgi:outer membrane protein assembly factor BamB